MRLILFDIDGTLLRDGIAAKIAFGRALRDTYQTSGPIEGFRFAGMTDPECVTEIMRLAGVEERTILARRDECLRRYVELLALEIREHQDAHLYPGVRELLERLNKLDTCWLTPDRNVLRGSAQAGALELSPTSARSLRRPTTRTAPCSPRSRSRRRVLSDTRRAETTVIGDTPRTSPGPRHRSPRRRGRDRSISREALARRSDAPSTFRGPRSRARHLPVIARRAERLRARWRTRPGLPISSRYPIRASALRDILLPP
jgi:phosphoglycolate phosphatase-like HAD superfamily hydrolase